jgi:hypothetical protein
MIRYALICDKGHEFEGWFKDSAAFDAQLRRGLVSCATCGSAKVGKSIMAPRLARTDLPPTPLAASEPQPVAMLSPEDHKMREMLKAFRAHVVANSDDVGAKFPEEARRMHEGEIEHRAIRGVATPDEARALHDDGIEVHLLPTLPDDRN